MGTGRREPPAAGAHDHRPRPAGPPGLLDAARLLCSADLEELLDTGLELALRITARGPLPSTPRRAFLYQLRPDDWLQLTQRLDLTDDDLSPYRLVPWHAELPIARAARENRAVVNVLDHTAVPYPGSLYATAPAQYWTQPLYLDGRCLGGVIFCLPLDASLGDEEQTLLTALAELFAERLQLLCSADLHPDSAPPTDAATDPTGATRPADAAPAAGPADSDAPVRPDGSDRPTPGTATGRDGTDADTDTDGRSEADSGPPASNHPEHPEQAERAVPPTGPHTMRRRGPLERFPSPLEQLIHTGQEQLRSNLDPMVDMALSNTGIGSFDWDFPSGRLIWDERLSRLHGIEPEEFDGRIETFFECVHPEDIQRVHDTVKESHRTGFYKCQYRVIMPDDTVRHMESESRVIFSPEGFPYGMVGIARDRTAEVRRAERNRRRQEFVMQVTGRFTAASSTAQIVSLMADTVMPTISASKMAILLREPDQPPRLVGLRGFREEHATGLMAAVRRLHTVPGPIRRGRTLMLENREQFDTVFDGEDLRPPADERAWLILPLSTADGLMGTCVLSFEEEQRFSAEDEAITTAVGGILAQSLARTRLFDERRSQLTELQQLMLPRRIPALPGLEVAVGYRPGSRGLMVGGDWYDALVMPDGTVSVIIGDVQGHNVKAAAVMGQLRTVMRVFAAEGDRLDALLARGNRALYQMDTDLFATCAIVEIDPKAGVVQMARAGHPYPLLVDSVGSVYEAEADGGMPLGCFPEDDYPVSDLPLPKGGTLLLFTDGLVENTGMEYGLAVEAITGTLSRWVQRNNDWHAGGQHGGRRSGGQRDLELLAEEIVSLPVDKPHLDDVAVLLVRRPG
ncbi:SpoIIE family protein phosphatase [Streptomyces sp. XM4193]|uniref:SpoIIE family protein phosphatase n=1 Tax=Streptomyces sp. XM4193 TaxID=2929782 RepID=UPI001FF93C85|nr:SpoIIE family protein phosphatase [Streptomyces sp. XM4193]MCK1795952.1 SpoIIE family protein phosphatase [Streptomyces sp. XM4193]